MSATVRLPLPDSLAARLRAGDAAALARLADATYGRALAVARPLTPDEASAERAVLDAYVALWFARREAPTDDARLDAWVLAAVGRVATRPPVPSRRSSGLAATVRRRLDALCAWAASLRGRRAPAAPTARGCAGLA
ncbi:hypothetical protein [Roseisolibacter agri]|uniref:RNA polymerase sigma-70 region 2 domain-containing protein n=1 Tax=Roseisolibacter agri TaxID=2014610 RepID=A0AA37QJM2_9BACT|nr:hypothetical protein [Roseisolibacter agri]GLC27023.1 hypothetical protein rosag_35360 [Roseisolibacter agri]